MFGVSGVNFSGMIQVFDVFFMFAKVVVVNPLRKHQVVKKLSVIHQTGDFKRCLVCMRTDSHDGNVFGQACFNKVNVLISDSVAEALDVSRMRSVLLMRIYVTGTHDSKKR